MDCDSAYSEEGSISGRNSREEKNVVEENRHALGKHDSVKTKYSAYTLHYQLPFPDTALETS